MSLPHKTGHKTRSGRKRNPIPHKSHRKPAEYSRVGRLLKQRVALFLAPQISDFDLDRPRLGHTNPLASGVHVTSRNGASAAATASPMAHQEVTR